jgi:hypothetical protein
MIDTPRCLLAAVKSLQVVVVVGTGSSGLVTGRSSVDPKNSRTTRDGWEIAVTDLLMICSE